MSQSELGEKTGQRQATISQIEKGLRLQSWKRFWPSFLRWIWNWGKNYFQSVCKCRLEDAFNLVMFLYLRYHKAFDIRAAKT